MTARRQHRGRVVIAGAGQVSQCLWWVLDRDLDMDWGKLLVVDQRPVHLPGWLTGRGARFQQTEFTRELAGKQIGGLAGPGDLFIDLTTCGTPDMAFAAYEAGAMYVSASATEEWDGDEAPTLHDAYLRLRARFASCGTSGPPVAVDCGMNPGGISWLVRAGLADWATYLLSKSLLPAGRAAQMQRFLDAEAWPRVARTGGAKVFQCTEWDDQVADPPREDGEAVSPWSVTAMHAEAKALAEIALGSHDTHLPPGARRHGDTPWGVALDRPAGELLVHGWTPTGGGQVGIPIAHGEGDTLPPAFYLPAGDGEPEWWPGYSYCYRVCPATAASVAESRAGGWRLQDRQRGLDASQIRSGRDEVCAAIWGGPTGWCYGTSLPIGTCRALAPGYDAVTPTTLQVAAFLAATIGEILDGHVKGGLRTPEDLDWKPLLAAARPYLGEILSVPSGWTPPGPGIPRPERADWRTWQWDAFAAQ